MIDTEQTMSLDKTILNRQNSIKNRELLVAASKGNPDKVKDLIQGKADVNFVDKDGNTALHYAVDSRNLKVVQLILDKIEDINVKNNVNESALNIARRINDNGNMNEIIEEIEDKILDTSLNMLKNVKGESSSTNVNKNGSEEQNIEEKIKDKINFCLKALKKLTEDKSQIKKFTYKNVNIFILFLEAFALQDVEVNNNLSPDKKTKYIKDIFKEKDNKIIKDIRNIYMHRETKTEDKTSHSIKDLILGPAYLQNFVVTENTVVNVKKFFEDIRDYVQGVYKKLINQQSEQDKRNQKSLDQILKCNSPYNKHAIKNKTLLDIFGDLVNEAYNSQLEQRAEQAENIMFNLIVNIIPLIGKDCKGEKTDFEDKLVKLRDLRNNLVHNFHHYDNPYFRIIMLKKAISSSRSNLFKYYFSEEVHNILIKIHGYENYSEVERKMSEKLKKSTEHLEEISLDLANEEVNSLEYKFVNLLFESKDGIRNTEVIEKLVDQYFKFMIIIDYGEIEEQGQMNNEDEANTFLNQQRELSDVERREVFEDFINLKKIQELSDEESETIKEQEVKQKLAGYFKIRDDDFDKIVKSYIKENNSLDQNTEKQAKKVTDIIKILITISLSSHFSIQDVIYLYEKRFCGSSDYEDMFKKNEINETKKLAIENKLNALPDSDEIMDVVIAGKSIQISIKKIAINMIKTFSNTYSKYQIRFNIKQLFNDDVFLNYLISRDITKDHSQRNQKPCYQFENDGYIFMIIKKLINIEYMAPYIACLVAKVQNTKVIEKDDLIKLLTILIKRDSYIPYLNELLCIKITEPGFCFYREVCNILRNNNKENIDIKNMDAVFKKPESVKEILRELQTNIENVTVELIQKVLKLLNNVILHLAYRGNYKTSEEIVNLKEIKFIQSKLKKEDPNNDSIIVEYKLNAAKVKNFRGLEEKQKGEYDNAEKLYKEALELLEGVSSMESSQSLLILSRRGYTKYLLKKHDEAYMEYKNLYKELAKLSSIPGKDVYSKENCIKIAETKSYQKLLDSSSEHMKYLNVTKIGDHMAYSKMCSKNYDEALQIYKEVYNVLKILKNRNESTSWIVKKVAVLNYHIANKNKTGSDYQSALQYYYDSLIEYNTVLEMENERYGSYHPIIKLTYDSICNLLQNIAFIHLKISKLILPGNRVSKHYNQTLNIRKSIYEFFKINKGEEDEHTLNALNLVVSTHIKLGDWHSLNNNREEAMKHCEEALNIRKSIYEFFKINKGEEDEHTLNALNLVASTYIKLGELHSLNNNRKEAMKHYEEALNVSKRIFEPLSDECKQDQCRLKALGNAAYVCATISGMESGYNPKKALQYCNESTDYNTIVLKNYEMLFDRKRCSLEQVKKYKTHLENNERAKKRLLMKLHPLLT